jgi:hypothetical protein
MAQQMSEQNGGTTGIGDDDIDQDGQPDPTQSQAETGGSGGAGLTRHEGDGAPDSVSSPARALHPSTQSGALGAEDTRSEQAGAHAKTGLGSAETGANQAPGDMAPASGPSTA